MRKASVELWKPINGKTTPRVRNSGLRPLYEGGPVEWNGDREWSYRPS
ncbi:MAG: hypothetical protein QW547_06230 [Candidatus Bathyarchaeia archaeon]